MSELFDTAIVMKRNLLNELRAKDFTLQELRFFSIYLSKINPRDTSTRIVKFPLSDYKEIMGLGRLNISQLRASTNSLLGKVVNIPKENGGYNAFQLFKECEVDQDDSGDWFVSIDAHDKALPLMFDFKDRYFKYELWNALQLHSPIQIRMYEILKQYEKLGKRELEITELRELLGIDPKKFSRLERFKAQVLDSCQKALKEKTDICYTYEKGKTGKSGKWLTIIFHIFKNEEYTRQMQLDGFLDIAEDVVDVYENKKTDINEPEPEEAPERLSDTLQNMVYVAEDLTLKELKEIYYTMQEANIYEDIFISFKRLYQTAVNNNPKSLKGYIIGIIKGDKDKEQKKGLDNVDPDIEEYKKVINKFLY